MQCLGLRAQGFIHDRLVLYPLSYTANSYDANLAETSLKVGHMTHAQTEQRGRSGHGEATRELRESEEPASQEARLSD